MKQSVDEFLAQQGPSEAQPSKQSVSDFLSSQQNGSSGKQTVDQLLSGQDNILSNPTKITQSFGTYNPIEPTAGHLAGDTNFSANQGDSVKVPPGQWQVVQAYNQAPAAGAPGDYINEGYGNDVILQNAQTGEKLRFLHMAGVNVAPGDVVKGGSVVGQVGDSGNSTGANLGVEYYDTKGNLNDFELSPYAQYLDK